MGLDDYSPPHPQQIYFTGASRLSFDNPSCDFLNVCVCVSLGRLLQCFGLHLNAQYTWPLFLARIQSCHCFQVRSSQKLLDQAGDDRGGKVRSYHQEPWWETFLWERLHFHSRNWQWQQSCASPAESWIRTSVWTGLLFLTVLAFLWLTNLPRGHHSFFFPGEHLLTVSRSQGEEKREGNGPQL